MKIKQKTLKDLNLSEKDVKKLTDMAESWLRFIQYHLDELHPEGDLYHEGQIDIIKLLFNIDDEDNKFPDMGSNGGKRE